MTLVFSSSTDRDFNLLLFCETKTSTLESGRLTAETVILPPDVSMKNLVKNISINNSAGNVNLKIPKNTGINLKLYAMKISTETFENFKGTNNKEEIEGTLSGGGIPVTVDAGSGKINLEFY